MMPLAMGSFPLQLESIMFSLFVFSAILLCAGLAEGDAAGGLNSHDLAKRVAGEESVAALDSAPAGIKHRHPRVKRHPRGPGRRGSHEAGYPVPSAPAVIPTTAWAPFTAYTVRYTGGNTYQPSLAATNNHWPPYTGGAITYHKTTQYNPFYRATTANNLHNTQWVPTLPWTGPSTKGPWMPVHTNPWRPPPLPTKSTEEPGVIEFTPSPDPQSGSDAITTRYIIIGSVSGGVLIIVIVFIIVAIALARHRRRPVADVENEMKVIPPPVVSNTPLNSVKVKSKKGSKSSRKSKQSNRDKSSLKKGIQNPTISSQPESLYEN